MAELAFFRHGEELLRVAVGEKVAVGRAPECDVALPDPALSRVQAVVERRGERYHLVDRSGRGTRLGGAAVAEAPLDDGAELSLGGWRVLFRAGEPPGAELTRQDGLTAVRDGAAAAAARPPAARLRVRERGEERSVLVPPGGATVGKDPSSEVVLSCPFVSGRHLRVEPEGGRWWVQDLGSTNGTRLGGLAVSRAELVPGVVVSAGEAELWLEPPRVERPAAFEGMTSRDPSMTQVFELIEQVAPGEVAVTIFGETGTGKELVARALHARSGRGQAPFVPVNCSAIAESLIESELFGHEKGAFSGADRLRKGAFEEADGGTIFLDEIGELPPELQPKLLRALELGEVKRVGASRPIQVRTRIVAATHRDLRALVRAGRFREDLYYRLCVVPIHVPPLRARPGDVRALAEELLARAAPRGASLSWSAEALQKLEAYDWPGNVRQLKNTVQRALLFRGEGRVVPATAITFDDTRAEASLAHAGTDEVLVVKGLTMEEVERETIRLALRRNGGRRAVVARELGIAKSTVMKRIGQWGLHAEGRGASVVAEGDDEE
ncbi:MAG TPA: sigma 54-interacting transcriptional regulator [Anaeromyxobacteraceae bacterium]|jgi:DNA-binding NtrC family response regulator|nr:sigma 54-interacting transcriptional regulator [Anaeromyxobacteraceae bacterium]